MASMKQLTQEELCTALKYHFCYDSFRPFQLDAIQATLAGRDSLLILPTGGGKSLTFQMPALARGNCFTVVVGPLMALAKDQVDSCLDLGIDARVWNSDTSEEARKGIQADLVSDEPEMRLLYTTPESLRHPSLRGYLKEAYESGTLLSFAIDEAHCVSEWGHDFRPAYLELASLKQDFPNIPIGAMTASCTPTVEAGIIKLLKLQDPLLIKGGFNRPNIQYQVLYKEMIDDGKQDNLVEHLVEFIRQREGQCGIIYARLRATCDWLGSALGNCDLDVGVYHAGKDAARRRKVQSDWCEGGLDIVVATVAFGMGIDRSDVRWVVHWDVPASLEGYYQESGRAGRDGAPSEAVLYVSADDLDTLTKLEKGTRAGSAAAVASFSCQGGCKRKKLLEYFGQRRGPCDASQGELLCDYCSQPGATRQLITQWEQQLQRKAVAHMLREQRKAAGLPEADADAEAEDAAAAAAAEGAAAGAAAAEAKPGGNTGWQTGGSAAGSRAARPSKPRPGVWAPAKAHSSGATTAADVDINVDAVFGQSSGSICVQTTMQDENRQPGATAGMGQAASGAVECSTEGVLLPQPAQQQEFMQPKGPAEKPLLKKRRLSHGQQRAWGAFKAPRQQPSSATAGKPPQCEGQLTSAAAVGGGGDASSVQDAAIEGTQQQDEQQQRQQQAPLFEQQQHAREQAGISCEAVVSADHEATKQASAGPSSAAVAVAMPSAAGRIGLRRGLGRAAGRHAFQPPFKR